MRRLVELYGERFVVRKDKQDFLFEPKLWNLRYYIGFRVGEESAAFCSKRDTWFFEMSGAWIEVDDSVYSELFPPSSRMLTRQEVADQVIRLGLELDKDLEGSQTIKLLTPAGLGKNDSAGLIRPEAAEQSQQLARELIFRIEAGDIDSSEVIERMLKLVKFEGVPFSTHDTPSSDSSGEFFRRRITLATGYSFPIEFDVTSSGYETRRGEFEEVEEIVAVRELDRDTLSRLSRCLAFWLEDSTARPKKDLRAHRNAGRGTSVAESSEAALSNEVRRLLQRFERLADDFPLMRLVVVLRPKCIEEVEYECDVCERQVIGIHPVVEGRFQHQLWFRKPITQDERGVYLLSPPDLTFPSWHFDTDSEPWVNGLWAAWLHRDVGSAIPRDDPKSLNAEEQMKCLELFSSVLHDAGILSRMLFADKWPAWVANYVDNSCDMGDPPFTSEALRWLLGLIGTVASQRETAYPRKARAKSPHHLRIVKDIAEESANLLRRWRNSSVSNFDGDCVVEELALSTKPSESALEKLSGSPNQKQQRNDWLLELYETHSEKTLPDLLEDLSLIAPTKGWDLLEATSSIGSALREAYERQHGKPWPYDRRGKSKQRNN